jgi:hypothetical protein
VRGMIGRLVHQQNAVEFFGGHEHDLGFLGS